MGAGVPSDAAMPLPWSWSVPLMLCGDTLTFLTIFSRLDIRAGKSYWLGKASSTILALSPSGEPGPPWPPIRLGFPCAKTSYCVISPFTASRLVLSWLTAFLFSLNTFLWYEDWLNNSLMLTSEKTVTIEVMATTIKTKLLVLLICRCLTEICKFIIALPADCYWGYSDHQAAVLHQTKHSK